jgi:hypothetical protein
LSFVDKVDTSRATLGYALGEPGVNFVLEPPNGTVANTNWFWEIWVSS